MGIVLAVPEICADGLSPDRTNTKSSEALLPMQGNGVQHYVVIT